MDTLVRLQRSKGYLDEYKNMPGVNMALYDERITCARPDVGHQERRREPRVN